jgi:hypothetical protein
MGRTQAGFGNWENGVFAAVASRLEPRKPAGRLTMLVRGSDPRERRRLRWVVAGCHDTVMASRDGDPVRNTGKCKMGFHSTTCLATLTPYEPLSSAEIAEIDDSDRAACEKMAFAWAGAICGT